MRYINLRFTYLLTYLLTYLRHIVARATSTPASQAKAPPVYATGKTDPLGPDPEGLDLEDFNLEESDHEEEDLERQDQDLQKTLYSPPRQAETKPPAPSRTMPQFSDVLDLQLQLRRLELEDERERVERQHELKKLELEMSRASDPSAHPTDPPSSLSLIHI